MKFAVEIDPDLNPDAVGEFLRSSFFNEKNVERKFPGRTSVWHPREVGCYQTFEWQKDVVPLEQVEVDPEEKYSSFKLFWTRGKKTFADKTVECRYYWDGDGVLVFELPDGKCLANHDCKKDHGWKLVDSLKECS